MSKLTLRNIVDRFRDARGKIVVLCGQTATSAAPPEIAWINARVGEVSYTCIRIFGAVRLNKVALWYHVLSAIYMRQHKSYISSRPFLTRISWLSPYCCSCPAQLIRILELPVNTRSHHSHTPMGSFSKVFHSSGTNQNPLFRGVSSKYAASYSPGMAICIGYTTSWKKETIGKSCIVNIWPSSIKWAPR